MELTLQVNDSILLEVRLTGEAEGYVSAGSSQLLIEKSLGTAPLLPDNSREDLPSEEPEAENTRRTRAGRGSRPSKAEVPSPTPAPPAPVEVSAPVEVPPPPADVPPTTEDPTAIPSELSNLPKKHIDFYRRKFAEYQEVYPDTKARELAIKAVRAIAGHGPKR